MPRCRTFQPEGLDSRRLLSTLSSLPAVPAEVQSDSHQVPFEGKCDGTASIVSVSPLGVVTVGINGAANFSHLGKSTIEAQHSVVFRPDSSIDILGGRATVTAANGDRLVLDYAGTGVPNGFGGFDDTYGFTVDGGLSTGRFAGVTGGGVIHADDSPGGSLATGFPFTGDLVGQIVTVGANTKG
jgi:hypothetical protein